MIEKLYLKNYLILDESEIDLMEGLNILTGETGAGKSIIIDALSLILGERADFSKIKKDQEKLVVEAHFNFKDNFEVEKILSQIFSEEKIDAANLILRRELLRKGISRNFINDTPMNISDMKRIGEIIIDIHSQNEHQSLFNKETHIEILDEYAGLNKLNIPYSKNFKELKGLINDYKDLSSRKEELAAKKEFLNYELREINNLDLKYDEDSELENELKKLENTESISAALETALNALNGEEYNSSILINAALREIRKIQQFDKSFENIINDLENAHTLIKENIATLSSFQSKLNFDSEKTELVRNRLSSISHLKRKYKLTVNELIEKAELLSKELLFAENFDYELEQLFKKIEEKKKDVFKSAAEISELRKKKLKELTKNINLVFKEVGLENADFKVEINSIYTKDDEDLFVVCSAKNIQVRLGEKGFDEIEFFVRTNKNTDYSPLRKSASGGEISRIMLSIKTVLSEKDRVGILVFDEIDAGISGRIAQKVGKIMKKLSETHQIICITHLPQIAAMSDRHFHVSKEDNRKETVAKIKYLTKEEKVVEVAKLISGEKVTEASTKSALELISA